MTEGAEHHTGSLYPMVYICILACQVSWMRTGLFCIFTEHAMRTAGHLTHDIHLVIYGQIFPLLREDCNPG